MPLYRQHVDLVNDQSIDGTKTFLDPISGSVTGSAGSVAASALTGTTLASGVTASSLTSVGTIGTGTWQGTAIASAYLDADTAHLTTTQTFSGTKTFSAVTTVSNTTEASSTTVAALVVNGGIGVAKNVRVGGTLYATAKSFDIKHPTKDGMRLRYGSLEGPENGVYVRGRLQENNIIELPDYWTKLIDPDSISVQLTPITRFQKLYVKEIFDNKVMVANASWISKNTDCFYIVYAERIDVNKITVEYFE
jgi:hypothetical protein